MPLSFFTKQKYDETLSLLVDIGSASVGVALVKFEKGRAPHILATVRENISFQEVLSSGRFLLGMNHALDKALKSIQPNVATSSIAHIFCTLSSPWFILKSRHLNISRDQEFEISERALDEFINEDIVKLKEELKGTLPSKDIKIIEKKIVQMKLNGYDVKNPYGQKTSRMEIAMTVGVSSEKVIESIERKLMSVFHSKSVHFGAFPLAAFSAVRDIFPTEKNFIFLDITGEATDVSLVNNDLLVGTVSFPRGKNFFIREISTELRTVHEEAATLFGMFLRNELETKKSDQIAKIITRAEGEWLARFEKALGAVAESGALSHKLFFTTDADISPLFSRIIGETKSELLMNAPLDAQYLDQHIVSKFVSFETQVTRDPFMVVEALLVEKIFTQHI